MAKERTSVRMQTQIKLMSEQGHSLRSIARVLPIQLPGTKGRTLILRYGSTISKIAS